MKRSLLSVVFQTVCSGLFVWLVFPALLCGAELQVGAASVDITPNKAVALWGQFGLRLSTKPDTPLTANVVALQSGDARTTLRLAGPPAVARSLRPSDPRRGGEEGRCRSTFRTWS